MHSKFLLEIRLKNASNVTKFSAIKKTNDKKLKLEMGVEVPYNV